MIICPRGSKRRCSARCRALHAEEIEALGDYEEDTAGSIMDPDFVALRERATVADALTRLRRLALVGRNVNYVYVVDGAGPLVGRADDARPRAQPLIRTSVGHHGPQRD